MTMCITMSIRPHDDRRKTLGAFVGDSLIATFVQYGMQSYV
jgi:hypothetical protein